MYLFHTKETLKELQRHPLLKTKQFVTKKKSIKSHFYVNQLF